MAEEQHPAQSSEAPAPPGYRERARFLLGSGQTREAIRIELAQLREAELVGLMHEAAVLESSPFWREVVLRRFIRQRGVQGGEPANAESVERGTDGR